MKSLRLIVSALAVVTAVMPALAQGDDAAIVDADRPNASENQVVVGRVLSPDKNARYEEVYRLEEGEYIRLICPPYIDDRLRLYGDIVSPSQVEAIPGGPDRFVIAWDGAELHRPSSHFGGGEQWSWEGIVTSILGLLPHEIIAAEDLIAKVELSGDWIIRDGLSQEERLAAFAAIIASRSGIDVRFEKQTITREVWIASGTYNLNLIGEQYDPINFPYVYVYASDELPEDWAGGYGGPSRILDPRIGARLGIPIFGPDIVEPNIVIRNPASITFRFAPDLFPDEPEEREEALDSIRINLSEQTGLTIGWEEREMEIWAMVDADSEESDIPEEATHED